MGLCIGWFSFVHWHTSQNSKLHNSYSTDKLPKRYFLLVEVRIILVCPIYWKFQNCITKCQSYSDTCHSGQTKDNSLLHFKRFKLEFMQLVIQLQANTCICHGCNCENLEWHQGEWISYHSVLTSKLVLGSYTGEKMWKDVSE